MKAISFSFSPGSESTAQEQALEMIRAWKGVTKAERLKPGAKNPLVRRLGYAYVEEDADAGDVASRLEALPEIESASVPPTRTLVRR